jgi:uncharacterized membrane protein
MKSELEPIPYASLCATLLERIATGDDGAVAITGEVGAVDWGEGTSEEVGE